MSIGFKKPVYGKIYFIALQRPYSGTLRMHLQCIILNFLSVELYIDYKLLNQICISTFELGVNPDHLLLKSLGV